MRSIKRIFIILTVLFTTLVLYKIFKPIKPANGVVQNFDVEKYAGTWYEIARIDFYWEKGLSRVTANYTLLPDGSIKVTNKGFDAEKNQWKQSVGKAKFIDDKNTAALKVSFFGPFYNGYNVVKIDENYQYALIFGKNLDFLWILSRQKSIPEDVKNEFLDFAKTNGYDTERLLWTVQDQ